VVGEASAQTARLTRVQAVAAAVAVVRRDTTLEVHEASDDSVLVDVGQALDNPPPTAAELGTLAKSIGSRVESHYEGPCAKSAGANATGRFARAKCSIASTRFYLEVGGVAIDRNAGTVTVYVYRRADKQPEQGNSVALKFQTYVVSVEHRGNSWRAGKIATPGR